MRFLLAGLLLAAVLLPSITHAQEGYTVTNDLLGKYVPDKDVGDSKLVGSLDLEIQQNWKIELNGQQPSELTFITYAFQNNPWQTATDPQCTCSPAACTVAFDNDNYSNKRVRALFTPTSDESISCTTRVHTNYLQPVGMDTSSTAAFQAFSQYTEPSPEVRSAALSEIVGARDDLERAVMLTGWVRNLVSYDISYLGQTTPASQVYSQRAGVCNEYSHLLMAGLKAQSIPVRFAAGLVYSGKEWGPHAWTEAFVDGKWQPLDATYNEAGILDATHLKLAQGLDQSEIKEELLGRGFSLDLNQVKIHKMPIQMHIIDAQPFPAFYSHALDKPSEPFGEGSLAQLNLTVSCLVDFCSLPLVASVPKEVQITTQPTQLLYLRKGEQRVTSWKVLLPATLDKGFIYTYPFQLLGLGYKETVNVTAKVGGAVSTSADVSLEEVAPTLTPDDLKIHVVLRNTGNQPLQGVAVSLTLENNTQTQTLEIPAASSAPIDFSFAKPTAEKTPLSVKVESPSGLVEREYVIDSTLPQVPTTTASVAPITIESLSKASANIDNNLIFLAAGALFAIVIGVAVFALFARRR